MICLECRKWCQHASAVQPPGKNAGRHFEAKLHSTYSALQESVARGCNLCAIVEYRINESRKDDATARGASTESPQKDIEPQPADEVHLGLFLDAIDPRERCSPSLVYGTILSCLKNTRHQDPLTFVPLRGKDNPYEWHDVGNLVVGMPESIRLCLQQISDIQDDHTGSDYAFRLISAWMQHCLTLHECPKPVEESLLPARVLDVGPSDGSKEPFLIETSGASGRYLALSHCWGDPATSGIVRTTQDTFADRLAAIPMRTLPKTFQDAILITRKLGVRWLWIDSLCIIQDSPEDWETQAAQMCLIYRNAYLTIAASSASNSSVGCFTPRNGHEIRELELPFTIPSDWTDFPREPTFLSLGGAPRWRNENFPVPLSTRCWTLQERVLSARVLSYEAGTVAFYCVSSECNEADPSGRFHQEASHKHNQLQRSFLYSQNPGEDSAGAKSQTRITTYEEQAHHMSWTGVVENYTERQLTYHKDKLAAIYGIADAVQQRKGDVYLAGLWKTWLLYDLLWGVDWKREGSGRPAPAVAPSWSWASVNGPIDTFWSRTRLGQLRLQPMARFVSAEVNGPVSTQTGSIVMEGYLKHAIASKDPSYSKVKVKTQDDDRVGDLEEGEYRLYDSKSHHPLDAMMQADDHVESGIEIIFVALVRMASGDFPQIVCLALNRDGPDGYFKRVGLARWAEYAWFDQRRPSDLKLGLKLKFRRRAPGFVKKIGEGRQEENVANAGWTHQLPRISKAESKSGGLREQTITIT